VVAGSNPAGVATISVFGRKWDQPAKRRWVTERFKTPVLEEDSPMALLDDIPVVGEVLGGGNWVTGLAIGVGAFVVLPLAAPLLRPLAKAAIKGGLQAYRGAAGWVSDLVFEALAERGGEVAEQAAEMAAEAAG
jgi:hypothetical protein